MNTLVEYQVALENKQYELICESYCHEGIHVDASFYKDTLDERYVEVGVCSLMVRIPMREMPSEYHNDGFLLDRIDYEQWTDRAKTALGEVARMLVERYGRGQQGC